ncbi:unnamed protein product [Cuscuta epithymum]|uniref:Uncharacterized protein n=1 Tax=Cuscuta epithymum TaxID=186058 RepID=A0AAV0EDL9_9ASTE|nr:unnamed protein product [Cuscuta epithymum]
MAKASNTLIEEIQAQLEAVREELRASKSSDAAQLEAVREEMRQRIVFLQGENDALRSQVQSVASIASSSRRGEDVATMATRLDTGSIPASTEPFIPHFGADTSGGAGPSTRSFPPPNPRRNIFRNLFAQPQRQHVPNHVDIPRYVDINNQRRQVPSHVDIPRHVDIIDRSCQEPEVVTIYSSPEGADPQIQTNLT